MSLLMKALEKASKDRASTDAAQDTEKISAPRPGSAPPDLRLEPIPLHSTASHDASTSPRNPQGASATAHGDAPADPRLAGVIRQAGERRGSSLIGHMSDHPLITFGACAALFLACYGGYIYLQITRPTLLVRLPMGPVAVAGDAPNAHPSEIATSKPDYSAAPAPLALAPLLQPPAAQTVEPGLPRLSAAVAAPRRNSAATGSVATAVPAAPNSGSAAIQVSAGDAAPALNPLLAQAYQAYNSGRIETAQPLYEQALKSEPENLDVRYGLAAIAALQGDQLAAARHYVRILELDPRNALAHAGLIAMASSADPLAAETRLKQLIARDPHAADLGKRRRAPGLRQRHTLHDAPGPRHHTGRRDPRSRHC